MLSGTGTGRKRTIPALLGSSVARVTVVHGRTPDKLEAVRELDPAIRTTTDTAEFAAWADSYDIVYVASPPFLHVEQLALAFSLGKPVICEKPLVATPDQLADLLGVLPETPPPFMVAHHLRHQPIVADLKRLLAARTVSSAHLQWSYRLNSEAANAAWKLDPARGGGTALFDVGVHVIDLATYLFGNPERVTGLGDGALLGHPGFTVTVTASHTGSTLRNDLTVTCADGVLRSPMLFGERSGESLELITSEGTETTTYPPVDLYRAEVEDFCRHLRGEPLVGTSLHEAVVTAELLFAIDQSAHGQ